MSGEEEVSAATAIRVLSFWKMLKTKLFQIQDNHLEIEHQWEEWLKYFDEEIAYFEM